jgi:hypothetical protein
VARKESWAVPKRGDGLGRHGQRPAGCTAPEGGRGETERGDVEEERGERVRREEKEVGVENNEFHT